MTIETTHKEMSLGDHLDELRRRLIYSLWGVAVAMVVTFIFAGNIVTWIIEPLVEVQRLYGLPVNTFTRSVLTGFTIYCKVALISAAIIASPWIIYQLWKFIEAGLYPTERRVAVLLMPMSAILSVIGVFFVYYIFLPATLTFFIYFTTTYPQPAPAGNSTIHKVSKFFMWFNDATYGLIGMSSSTPRPSNSLSTTTAPSSTQPADAPLLHLRVLDQDPPKPSEGEIWINRTAQEVRVWQSGQLRIVAFTSPSLMVPLIDPDQYINEVLILMIVVVIIFQAPVVMTLLAASGLVDPKWLMKHRKYIFFGCFVVAIFITPSQDLFSNVVLPTLMYGLFELGLLFMRMVWEWNKEGDVGDP